MKINDAKARVDETDLLEQSPKELDLTNGEVELTFSPFEIKTLKVSKK